eukprot:g8888.t1
MEPVPFPDERRDEISDSFQRGAKLNKKEAWKVLEAQMRSDPETHDPLRLVSDRRRRTRDKKKAELKLQQALSRVVKKDDEHRFGIDQFTEYLRDKSDLASRRNLVQTLGRAPPDERLRLQTKDLDLELNLERVKHQSRRLFADQASLFSRYKSDGWGGNTEVYKLHTGLLPPRRSYSEPRGPSHLASFLTHAEARDANGNGSATSPDQQQASENPDNSVRPGGLTATSSGPLFRKSKTTQFTELSDLSTELHASMTALDASMKMATSGGNPEMERGEVGVLSHLVTGDRSELPPLLSSKCREAVTRKPAKSSKASPTSMSSAASTHAGSPADSVSTSQLPSPLDSTTTTPSSTTPSPSVSSVPSLAANALAASIAGLSTTSGAALARPPALASVLEEEEEEEDVDEEAMPKPSERVLKQRRGAVDYTASNEAAAIAAMCSLPKGYASRRRGAVDHSADGSAGRIVAQLGGDEGAVGQFALRRRNAVDHSADGSQQRVVEELAKGKLSATTEEEEEAVVPGYATRRRDAVDHTADGSAVALGEQLEQHAPPEAFAFRRRNAVDHSADCSKAGLVGALLVGEKSSGETKEEESVDAEEESSDEDEDLDDEGQQKPPAYALRRRNAVDHSGDGSKAGVVAELAESVVAQQEDQTEVERMPAPPAFALRRRNAVDHSADGLAKTLRGKAGTAAPRAASPPSATAEDTLLRAAKQSEELYRKLFPTDSEGYHLEWAARSGRRNAVDHSGDSVLKKALEKSASSKLLPGGGKPARKKGLAHRCASTGLISVTTSGSSCSQDASGYSSDDDSISAQSLTGLLDFMFDRGLTVERLFEICDENNSGDLTRYEFCDSMIHMHFPGGTTQLGGIFALLDKDHDGSISREEFLQLKPYYLRRKQGFKY